MIRILEAPDYATSGIGWRYRPAANLDHAGAFKDATGLPIIANGGFQFKDQIESALQSDKCDLLAMARPLLANPDLMELYRKGVNAPTRPCTHCNRCSMAPRSCRWVVTTAADSTRGAPWRTRSFGRLAGRWARNRRITRKLNRKFCEESGMGRHMTRMESTSSRSSLPSAASQMRVALREKN
jgi:tRNA-dihydrouridine synthase